MIDLFEMLSEFVGGLLYEMLADFVGGVVSIPGTVLVAEPLGLRASRNEDATHECAIDGPGPANANETLSRRSLPEGASRIDQGNPEQSEGAAMGEQPEQTHKPRRATEFLKLIFDEPATAKIPATRTACCCSNEVSRNGY